MRETKTDQHNHINPEQLHTVLVTDCGSTTTKALLFQRTADGWRMTGRGEAPTTVEEPIADVTVGALNAFKEIEEITGRKILSNDNLNSPFLLQSGASKDGINIYLSTSSAGGGLQMLVAGVVRGISAESAERAALGAGAIVMDVISADDGREDAERIERIRHLKPDIVLIAGGTENGTATHPVELAELMAAAAPRPRFGDTYALPVIYCGNSVVSDEIREVLARTGEVRVVSNVRPKIEQEDLEPARDLVHDFFLSHVMSHAPGYGKLLTWSPVPVIPTPAGVGEMVTHHADSKKISVLCVDIGGATTDVFSVFPDDGGQFHFNRTVSANVGMSYSVANVLLEVGPESISRWLPYSIDNDQVSDRIRNKMIRPTSIPQSLDDLWLEQAVCREALALSLKHHRMLAKGLAGTRKSRTISDMFSQRSSREELVNLDKLDLVIGSGGVLSHAPDRRSAALMMIDGFCLSGLTELAVDSVFMMPHLGVLATVAPQAASEIFYADCLVRIGYLIAPTFSKNTDAGAVLATVSLNGSKIGEVISGELLLIEGSSDGDGELLIELSKGVVLCGESKQRSHSKKLSKGTHTFFLDGRNRPINLGNSSNDRVEKQRIVYKNLGILE